MESRGTVVGTPPDAASSGSRAARPAGRRSARLAGWALLGACLLLVAVALVAGERTESYRDLRAAITRGDVDEVTVSQGFSGDFRGRVTVDVHWRTATGWRVAQVVEQHPLRQERVNGLPVVYDVAQDLRELDPGLQVERRSHWRERTADTALLDWRLPAWCGLVMLGVWAGAVLLLVGGPPPWRATRWAWFWLLALAAPVGVPAFLLLGGPCGLLPPAPGRRPWLGGVVGLLLALTIGGVIGTIQT